MVRREVLLASAMVAVLTAAPAAAPPQDQVITVPLDYRAPGAGPRPNFSPKGTQVPLSDVGAKVALPAGAVRPARAGTMKIGPGQGSWLRVLAAADAEHPADLCRLYIDRNRNGRFDDDGPGLVATMTHNEKTKAWWSSFNGVEISIPYGPGDTERYLVNFWAVRDGDAAPDVIRYSVGSWRAGTATVDGIPALVAAMDSDNDGVFRKDDEWCVLPASAPDAPKAVLSINESRPTDRLMFVDGGGHERVLQWRSFSPDGRSVTFAVVNLPVTKAEDRAPDDFLAAERSRPRATTPFPWRTDLAAALVEAKQTGKRVVVDFETTWCGPCHSMDQWVWTDAEVAGVLSHGYLGVKLDGDVAKAEVTRLKVAGYPTIVVLDASGKETTRAVGYQSSAQTLALLRR